MNSPPRVDVLGSQISVCNMQSALDAIGQRLAAGEGGYVCFTNVHATITGRQNAEFQKVTNSSFLSLPDGKPVYWVGKALGAQGIGHVPGPDLFIEALHRFPEAGHFFYGSTPETLERLLEAVRRIEPRARIVGALSPPFRVLSDDEKQAHYRMIRESGAGLVWVGLGAPKQELWMAAAAPQIAPAILFGIGAGFDFHAGTVQRAPDWMKAVGLEWFHRLCQEPKRLWKRYLVTNSIFVVLAARSLIPPRTSSLPKNGNHG